jgi:lipoprotein NlpD
MLLVVHSACTSTWRAPVESRTHRPATPQAARPTIQAGEYRVQRGDTLYGIAWQSGNDYRSLAVWNGIRAPYHIYPGQTLQLRPPNATRTPPPPTPPVARSEPRRPPGRAPAQRPPAPRPAPQKPPQSAAQASRSLTWRWPANGQIVSSFKADDPLRNGIKIAGRSGDPIVAAESGKVVYSGSGLIGYGRLIIIKHNDNYLSAYGHNRTILVDEGDQVTKGQKIAEMGTANSGESLLHFEIRRDGKPVDPQRVLKRR